MAKSRVDLKSQHQCPGLCLRMVLLMADEPRPYGGPHRKKSWNVLHWGGGGGGGGAEWSRTRPRSLCMKALVLSLNGPVRHERNRLWDSKEKLVITTVESNVTFSALSSRLHVGWKPALTPGHCVLPRLKKLVNGCVFFKGVPVA